MKYFTKEMYKILNKKKKFTEKEKNMIIKAALARNNQKNIKFPNNEFNFQNIKIKSLKKILKNYIIEFETENEYSDSLIKSITFINAKVLKQDDDIENSIWIFDEIYNKQKKYELHLLLKKKEELIDFTIECDKAIITLTELGKENKENDII